MYLTLGTVFNSESGDLFARAVDGLRALPARILVTVGPGIDPSIVPVSEQVRVESFVSHAAVLPYCDLVVSHGGSGTVIGALAHGIPQIVVPMGADQQLNADRVTALSVGLVLDPIASTSGDFRKAAERILASAVFKDPAERMQREIEQLPRIGSVIADLVPGAEESL